MIQSDDAVGVCRVLMQRACVDVRVCQCCCTTVVISRS